MNIDERRFLIKSGRTPKSAKKFRHAEIFFPIGFGCRFASRMNCDKLGWTRWTWILWRFWNFQNREQIGVCGTAVLSVAWKSGIIEARWNAIRYTLCHVAEITALQRWIAGDKWLVRNVSSGSASRNIKTPAHGPRMSFCPVISGTMLLKLSSCAFHSLKYCA